MSGWEYGLLVSIVDRQNGCWHGCYWRRPGHPDVLLDPPGSASWTNRDFTATAEGRWDGDRFITWPYDHSQAVQDARWGMIAELGTRGWELVTVEGYTWYFKRPKPTAEPDRGASG